MNENRFLKTAKGIGLVSSLLTLIAWVVITLTNQYYPEIVTQGTWITDARMIILAAGGILTSLLGQPFLMLLIFLISFYPEGMYLLGVPGAARMIGVFNIIFFLAAILMSLAKYRARRAIFK